MNAPLASICGIFCDKIVYASDLPQMQNVSTLGLKSRSTTGSRRGLSPSLWSQIRPRQGGRFAQDIAGREIVISGTSPDWENRKVLKSVPS